jgi:hypothetical protein
MLRHVLIYCAIKLAPTLFFFAASAPFLFD